MTSIEQLFIRACKSYHPKTRLASVYRRFYGEYSNSTFHIAGILASICDKYITIKAADFIDALNPGIVWKYDPKENLQHFEIAMNFMVSQIRHTKASDLKGLTPPLRFRRAA